MKRIQTILFDLDGTLIDSEPVAARAVEQCFRGWGANPEPADAAYVTGRTWASAFDYLFKKYQVPVSREQASRAIMERYLALLEENLPVVPGAVAAVRAIAAAGRFRLGLVSGSNRADILWSLGKLGILEHFEVVLGAEDYPRSKPAPDGFLKALSTLSGAGDSTLIFEDSTPGITAARAAGAWVVAITSTNHFGHDQSAAHHHIPDLTVVDAAWLAKR